MEWRSNLDGLFEPGDLFVEAFAFAVQSVVVALQLRVLLLQVVEAPHRVPQTFKVAEKIQQESRFSIVSMAHNHSGTTQCSDYSYQFS